MPLPYPYLVARGRQALAMNQQELAKLLGSSLRTVQRWEAGRASPYPNELQQLADAVRPHDPKFASEIDVWAPRPTPPAPAVVAPPPPPPPPPEPPPPIAPSVLVDSVVCAAAEAMAVAPQAIRPAVLAAFTRARDARLTPEGVIAVLAPPAAPTPDVSNATTTTPPRRPMKR
jgi:DNA-binding XRE family transcriptional regulator